MYKLAYELGRVLAQKQAAKLPDINKGDTILGGRFKNIKMNVKGLKKDDKGQPVVETNKGDRKALSFRLPKLMDDGKK